MNTGMVFGRLLTIVLVFLVVACAPEPLAERSNTTTVNTTKSLVPEVPKNFTHAIRVMVEAEFCRKQPIERMWQFKSDIHGILDGLPASDYRLHAYITRDGGDYVIAPSVSNDDYCLQGFILNATSDASINIDPLLKYGIIKQYAFLIVDDEVQQTSVDDSDLVVCEEDNECVIALTPACCGPLTRPINREYAQEWNQATHVPPQCQFTGCAAIVQFVPTQAICVENHCTYAEERLRAYPGESFQYGLSLRED